MLYFISKSIIMIVMILISIAFLTLFEQKVLSYSQSRKGPVKVGYKGLLQPFSDAMKLLSKEVSSPYLINQLIYFIAPILALSLMMIMWLIYPMELGLNEISLGMIFMMVCLSAGIYSLLGAGWSSNSKYAMLGSLRAVAQTISYEVSFAIILLSFIVLVASFNFEYFIYFNSSWMIFMAPPLSMIWFVSSLAETSRTPFDFSEGESEIVSGFNTEYSSGPFVLYFLAEYGSILFMSFVFSLVFLGGSSLSLLFYMKICFILFLFIWVRSTLPRLRYDKLMDLAWMVFLPVSLSYLMFFVGIVSMV
uniref:NADH-ubiquinone oxidoreductase chain 1 n=1 Tax=Bragasellus peltatus TaxID=1282048 RepID=A0A485M9L7_9CRUS|nr:NADH dehydrogenase subunit 1 [Bragasellus peltatus]